MLLLAIVVVALVVWTIGQSGQGPTRDARAVHTGSAREILDARLAAGDIEIDEYEQRRRALESEREHAAV